MRYYYYWYRYIPSILLIIPIIATHHYCPQGRRKNFRACMVREALALIRGTLAPAMAVRAGSDRTLAFAWRAARFFCRKLTAQNHLFTTKSDSGFTWIARFWMWAVYVELCWLHALAAQRAGSKRRRLQQSPAAYWRPSKQTVTDHTVYGLECR